MTSSLLSGRVPLAKPLPIGMGTREEPSVIVNIQNRNNNKANGDYNNRKHFNHRKITLHSFRRFVKSTISDLDILTFQSGS